MHGFDIRMLFGNSIVTMEEEGIRTLMLADSWHL